VLADDYIDGVKVFRVVESERLRIMKSESFCEILRK